MMKILSNYSYDYSQLIKLIQNNYLLNKKIKYYRPIEKLGSIIFRLYKRGESNGVR